MFVKAIESVIEFTRPILTIGRLYGSTQVEPGCATAIVINDEGWLLTCKHVAQLIVDADAINQKYLNFKQEVSAVPLGDGLYKTHLRAIEKKYGYTQGKGILAQLKIKFDMVDQFKGFQVLMHKDYDVALIRIDGFTKMLCSSFPIFAQDSTRLKQGMSLCRLGYPYPEFTDFTYDVNNDNIVWITNGRHNTPHFPMDGILTRHLIGVGNRVFGLELSTPGLRGQSGGPLFDINGIVCGMQSATNSLPLGFDQENREIKVKGVAKKVNDYSFIHLGHCIHIDVIKKFMDANGVKYNVG